MRSGHQNIATIVIRLRDFMYYIAQNYVKSWFFNIIGNMTDPFMYVYRYFLKH